MARATRTGWIEEICRLSVVWRSSEKSIRELFAPALPHIDDRAAFLAAVSGWLREHPDLIDAWQAYCEDKRTGRSPYFYFDQAWKVGFYDSSVKELAGRYQDERLHTDAVDACADFIYREALWVLRRARALSAHKPMAIAGLGMALTAEQLSEAMRRVAAWRAEPKLPVACPACGAEGLEVIDRSARPHAEWYALTCPACGLSETLHIPLGAVVHTLD